MHTEVTPAGLDGRTAAMLAAVRELSGRPCPDCARALCGHEVVLSVLLGYRNAPRCATCLARETGEARQALCERVLAWLRARDCYRAAWELAGAREHSADALRPACLFTGVSREDAAAPLPTGEPPPFSDAEFDAGDMACGELVLELRLRMRPLAPESVLRVHATDPAAPVDLPAWCGLTGHRLLSARHPLYWIARKDDSP